MKRNSSPYKICHKSHRKRYHDSPMQSHHRNRSPSRYNSPHKDRKKHMNSFLINSRIKRESEPEWGKTILKGESKSKPTVELKLETNSEVVKPNDKEKPNFGLSGKLTEDANMVNGVIIKYSEPDDSRKPKRRWRLYPFKGEKELPILHIHRQSAYLMGRDRKIADIPLDHPSCSKQHAVLQYRLVSFMKENGLEGRKVRPYLIDLGSANGTFINNIKLEARKFHELFERDVIKFGFSTREYVLLHEQSKDEYQDDDLQSINT